MHSNRRPRRASVVEMLRPHFVVAAEIVHIDEVARDLYAVTANGGLAQDAACDG